MNELTIMETPIKLEFQRYRDVPPQFFSTLAITAKSLQMKQK